MKRNDDCGFTGAVVLCGRSQATRAASERNGLDGAVDGGETEDDKDDDDEEDLDSGVDGFDDFNIVDAKALYAGVRALSSLKAR
jgi:hypothetical protein